MSLVRRITDSIADEVKRALEEYARATEAALKKRLRKMLIFGVITSTLSSLVVSLLATASLFLLIGSLEYLKTFLPAWKAWDVMGLTSGVAAGLLFLGVFILIRRMTAD